MPQQTWDERNVYIPTYTYTYRVQPLRFGDGCPRCGGWLDQFEGDPCCINCGYAGEVRLYDKPKYEQEGRRHA